jgi:hydroxymethylpyrimidine pyrophosphatase-like HAD family hydrolase
MVEGTPGYMLGLDLHGTLLEPGEIIREELVGPVKKGLSRIADRMERFLCTGNDLGFVKRKIPRPILEEIDGCVLETGCSVSPDGEREQVLTTGEERGTMKGLEKLLRDADFPEVNYFAHRLTTISMFCDDPEAYFRKVVEFVGPTIFNDLVHITYSSVAVDILPRGYNKHRGLTAQAKGRKTIGVADSMNDRALLGEADYAFAPWNMASALKPELEKKGRKVVPIGEARGLQSSSVIVASKKETRGVLEILGFLDRVLA